MAQPPAGFPIDEDDFFTDATLADSSPTFRRWRDLGEAVWSPCVDMFVVARFDDVVRCLRAPDQLISGEGVALNPMLNGEGNRGTISTISSDGDRHKRLKKFEMKPLSPRAMTGLLERVNELANERVAALADGTTFEAMAGLASYLPTTVVAELVGITGVDAERMLAWSNAAFDAFGPGGDRAMQAMPTLMDLGGFVAELDRSKLVPGGWADQLMDCADAGDLSPEEAIGLLQDYIVPSLDTTTLATGELLFQLAANPAEFERLKADPELVPSAVHEAVRLSTPIRGFSRLAVEDVPLGERVLPSGSRVWLVHASANRDERHYADPDRFDAARNPTDHVGWGTGAHLCVGKHVARIEMEAVLRSLLEHVERLEVDEPTRLVNNGLQGFEQLPMRLVPR
jgi:cytochrome P450